MKKGDRQIILNTDFNGKQTIEGEATLIKEVNNASNDYGLPLWKVRFDGEGEPVVLRTIYPPEHIAKIKAA